MTAQALADWLQTHGVDAAFSTDGTIPSMPDRLVVVTATGGIGEVGERVRDVVSYQFRVRGRQRVNADAEQLAQAVDDALMGAVPPLTIGGTRVISIQREGGPPSFIQRDDGGRIHFAANYLIQIARTTF